MNKILRYIFLVTVLVFSFSAHTVFADGVLSLDSTGSDTENKTTAIADGQFTDGWKWNFHITVPSDETVFNMKFSDWASGSSTIPVAGNMRFYSAQALDATTASSAITISSSDTYSLPLNIASSTDLDATASGTQIVVTVEVSVPTSTASGSYSTNYGIQSNPVSTSTSIVPVDITFATSTLAQVYSGTSTSLTINTVPQLLTGEFTVMYSGTSTLPVNAGSYDVAVNVVKPNYSGMATGTLVISPLPITFTATTSSKAYDGNISSTSIPIITSGFLAGSDICTAIEEYATSTAGTGIVITPVVNINDGNNGKNYSIILATSTGDIVQAVPKITFVSNSSASFVASSTSFMLDATSTSPEAIVFSILSGSGLASIDQSNNITFTGTGTVEVEASQIADINYTAASSTQTITVN